MTKTTRSRDYYWPERATSGHGRRGLRESENERGLGSASLGKAWNLEVEPQEAEVRDDWRGASGVGNRKGKCGRRTGVELTPEVCTLVGEGNQAYVDNDIEKTMEIMQEAIRVEPRAESAWHVLAHSGNSNRALLMRVMAAHLSNDPEEWGALAEISSTVLLYHVPSNAFQDRTEQDTARIARIAMITCAIHGNRFAIVVEQARKLINAHQFNNEPFHILLASLGHGMHATDAFHASTFSKHLLRELKSVDAACRNKDALKWNNVTKRYAPIGAKVEEDDDGDHVGISAAAKDGIQVLHRHACRSSTIP
ncbi:hypothetical protein BXZ70DRAFT_1004680 [Cristinia sonorae]|uniref:Uncharacterized protein n=1 Tax=Cristinia sonorae TaxID=1940300 RepID=A0A8K0UW15_9AGAR|nr:hypothetical protein BXZ70DRAFT_1004680 [Cristinia sonorae]